MSSGRSMPNNSLTAQRFSCCTARRSDSRFNFCSSLSPAGFSGVRFGAVLSGVSRAAYSLFMSARIISRMVCSGQPMDRRLAMYW